MWRAVSLISMLIVVISPLVARSQDKARAPRTKTPDGVYAVQRDSLAETDVLPLKDNEVLLVDHHRYLKTDEKNPPRFVVVHAAPEIILDLAGEPKAVTEGGEVVRILLTLKPKEAEALERLTSDRRGRLIAIILGGEVVTMHKARETIKGGAVQITSCTAGAAGYLLEQLKGHRKGKS